MWKSRGREFEAVGAAGAKALGQERACQRKKEASVTGVWETEKDGRR